jgi:hypothetical protein
MEPGKSSLEQLASLHFHPGEPMIAGVPDTEPMNKARLMAALNELAHIYLHFGLPRETRPTRNMVVERLSQIDRAVDDLLKAIGDPGYMLEMYLSAPIYAERENAAAWFQETLDRLRELQSAAREGAVLAEEDQTRPHGGTYSGDVAMNNLIEGLVRYVWEGLLRQRATLHWDAYVDGEEAARSPVVCFVGLVLQKLGRKDRDGKDYTLYNIREKIGKILRKPRRQ